MNSDNIPPLHRILRKGKALTDATGRIVAIDQLVAPKAALSSTAAAAPSAPEGGASGAVAPPIDYSNRSLIALYFSAHWCPPCRQFTPILIETYKELKRQGRHFEVVFCSMDREMKEYEDYSRSMPWLRLEFQDPRGRELSNLFSVWSIPSLIIVDAETGTVVSTGGRSAIPGDPKCLQYPWAGSGAALSGFGPMGKTLMAAVIMMVLYWLFVR